MRRVFGWRRRRGRRISLGAPVHRVWLPVEGSVGVFLGDLEGNSTSGCALIIAIRRVRWGSSVYVQKNSCSLCERGDASVLPSGFVSSVVVPLLAFLEVVTVEVEADIMKD